MSAWALSEEGRVRVLGASGYPDDTRSYQPGDDLRNVDWKRTYRTGQERPVVMVRKEHEERSLTVVADLSVLADEFEKLIEIVKDRTKSTPVAFVTAAPILSTIIHEAMVAKQNRLKVDLLLTHHAVIVRKDDCAGLLLGADIHAEEFQQLIISDASKAKALAMEEIKLFGESRFHPGNPLAHLEMPLRRGSLVHILPADPYKEEFTVLARALQRQGHKVTQGVLPGLLNLQQKA
jgi:hypothetical protein